jgi:hypothetical protein
VTSLLAFWIGGAAAPRPVLVNPPDLFRGADLARPGMFRARGAAGTLDMLRGARASRASLYFPRATPPGEPPPPVSPSTGSGLWDDQSGNFDSQGGTFDTPGGTS